MHYNCGLETLASTLLLKRKSALEPIDFLEVVKVDLSQVRAWLFNGKSEIDRHTRASLERLALDLDHPN